MNCKPIISKNINRHFKIYEKIKIHRVQCCLANKTLPKTGKVLRLRTLTCENELVYGYVIDEFRDMQKGRNFAPFSLLFGGERGIRTPGTLSRTHAFQACALNRSTISPIWQPKYFNTTRIKNQAKNVKLSFQSEKGATTRRLSDTNPQFLRGKKRDCPSPVLKQKRFNKAPSPIFSALCVFLYAEGTPFRNFRSRRICRRAVCRACPPANPPARAPYPCFRKA